MKVFNEKSLLDLDVYQNEQIKCIVFNINERDD